MKKASFRGDGACEQVCTVFVCADDNAAQVTDPQPIDISLIVPALNEGPNLRPLIEQIDAALRPIGKSYEVLIVDDNSTDETPRVVPELAKTFPVRLLV